MKKIFNCVLSFILTVSVGICLTGCDSQSIRSEKKTIVCTMFPQYDWCKEIIGDQIDNYNLVLLTDNGKDIHSYQATAKDMSLIASANLVIFGGGESDKWVKDAVKNKKNDDNIINMIEIVGENVETIHDEENDNEEHENSVDDKNSVDEEHKNSVDEENKNSVDEENKNSVDEEHKNSETKEHKHSDIDEHVWMSFENAKIIVNEITKKLSDIDSENSFKYVDNSKVYIDKLSALSEEYNSLAENSDDKVVIVADRFSFRYLLNEYNIKHYAAFSGCSAETEVSFDTIKYLADKINENDIRSVAVIENTDKKLAKTIIENTKDKNQKIVEINTMQSINSEQIKKGASYYSIMSDNKDALKQLID